MWYDLFQRLGVKDFDVIEVTIKAVVDYGFIVEVKPGVIKLLHLSQLTYDYVSFNILCM